MLSLKSQILHAFIQELVHQCGVSENRRVFSITLTRTHASQTLNLFAERTDLALQIIKYSLPTQTYRFSVTFQYPILDSDKLSKDDDKWVIPRARGTTEGVLALFLN